MKLKKIYNVNIILNFIMFLLLCITLVFFLYYLSEFINYLGLDIHMSVANDTGGSSEGSESNKNDKNIEVKEIEKEKEKEKEEKKEENIDPTDNSGKGGLDHYMNELRICFIIGHSLYFAMCLIGKYFVP